MNGVETGFAHSLGPVRLRDQVDALLRDIATLIADAESLKGRSVSKDQRADLLIVTNELKQALNANVYPHPLPVSVFDPSDTRLFGRFAAIALVAQERIPLDGVTHVYGSGVYALYYTGDKPEYRLIASTETPIYIGKAQPVAGAVLVVEQGTAVTKRLREHAGSIGSVEDLEVSDFECRYLVVAAGWETPAELELMRFFRPLWNTGIGPVHGIGKHGDDAETRTNGRSPWDTLHPGRKWAAKTTSDQKPVEQIREEIVDHLREHPPVKTLEEVVEAYVAMLVNPQA